MKITAIRYSMLRVTRQFENDRAEVEVELGPKDSFEDGVQLAKSKCEAALRADTPADVAFLNRVLEVAQTAAGREKLARAIGR